MKGHALRETLARLHAELASAEPVDAALRADLERALADIRSAMEREHPPAAEDWPPLRETLEELALRFEQSHPLLTQAIGGVVRALGAMGI
jgi:hypothetical protein